MAKPPFVPIIPKKPIITVAKAKVVQALKKLGLGIDNRISKYPAAKTSYKRTGTLGKGWHTQGPMSAGNDLVVIIANPTKYAPFVQGLKTKAPKQKKVFVTYGWESVQTAGEEEWKKHKPGIEKALQGK